MVAVHGWTEDARGRDERANCGGHRARPKKDEGRSNCLAKSDLENTDQRCLHAKLAVAAECRQREMGHFDDVLLRVQQCCRTWRTRQINAGKRCICWGFGRYKSLPRAGAEWLASSLAK